ncbi:helix-turn-helix domain-containing protein [Flavobacterium sp. HJSW_4]|uniref:AraC family transcriptional regulator n=1 Tax=Flavobacterium sp. HJSW_4 TaxID=3344660 RepID=UPI0035F223B2
MDIIPNYSITLQNDFVFLEKEELHEFMHSNLAAHSHNYYILSFLYEGSVSHITDFEQQQVTAPAILMLDIDQVHTHPDMSDCKIVSIAFSNYFINGQHQKFIEKVGRVFSRPFITISRAELYQLNEIVEIVKREFSAKKNNQELLQALLNVLIIQCYDLSKSYPAKNEQLEKTYNGFKLLLKENFKKQHQVKFYADSLNVTTRVLTTLVKISTFKTPKQLIEEQLLLEAKRLLYWSNLTVKEVAWQLGFETDSYFNRFFKKHSGKTPKEYHKKTLTIKK